MKPQGYVVPKVVVFANNNGAYDLQVSVLLLIQLYGVQSPISTLMFRD